jgi:hypothetical protein
VNHNVTHKLRPFARRQCIWREGGNLSSPRCEVTFALTSHTKQVCCGYHSAAFQRLGYEANGKEKKLALREAAAAEEQVAA